LLPAAGETVKPKVAAINEIKKLQTEAAKPDAGEPVIKNLETKTREVNTAIESNKEAVLVIPQKGSALNRATIEIAPTDKGWAFSYEVNLKNSGMHAPFTSNEIMATREEAITAAKNEIVSWVQREIKNASGEEKAELQKLIAQAGLLNPKNAPAIKVEGEITKADIAKPEVKTEANPIRITPEMVKAGIKPKVEPIAEQKEPRFEKPKVEAKINIILEGEDAEKQAGILMELEGAKAGKRIHYEDYDGTPHTIGVPSTFPKWIPDKLRHRDLIDAVLKNINEDTLPTKANEVRLYNVVAERLGLIKAVDELAAEEDIDPAKLFDEAELNDQISTISGQKKGGVEEQAPIRPEVSGGDGKVEEEANPQFKKASRIFHRVGGKGATPAGKTAAALSKGESVPETIVLGERAPDVIAGFNPTTITDPMGKAATAEQKKIIKRQDIARELSEKLGVPIRVGKFNMRALGIFKPGQQVVRIKGGGKSGGLPTIFHEVAHFLDYQIGFSQLLNRVEREALMEEYGYKYSGNARKQEQEGFAEFVRFYMTGQKERAHNLAPEFYAKFERIMLTYRKSKRLLTRPQRIMPGGKQCRPAQRFLAKFQLANKPINWEWLIN